jgi:hypothetical protein
MRSTGEKKLVTRYNSIIIIIIMIIIIKVAHQVATEIATLGIAHILSFTISFENNSSSVCFKDQL